MKKNLFKIMFIGLSVFAIVQCSKDNETTPAAEDQKDTVKTETPTTETPKTETPVTEPTVNLKEKALTSLKGKWVENIGLCDFGGLAVFTDTAYLAYCKESATAAYSTDPFVLDASMSADGKTYTVNMYTSVSTWTLDSVTTDKAYFTIKGAKKVFTRYVE